MATDADAELWGKLPIGADAAMVIRRPRNPKNHNRAMGIVQMLTDSWPTQPGDVAPTFDEVLKYLKLKTGLVEFWRNLATNQMEAAPASIAFDSMPEDEFRTWWKGEAVPTVARVLGITPEEVEAGADPVKMWGTCQNPKCDWPSARATDEHHIFGGTAMRGRSEIMGLKIKLCRTCHDRAEAAGMVETKRGPMTNIEYWRRVFCHAIGADYETVYRGAAGAVKKYKLEGIK